jgi:transposase
LCGPRPRRAKSEELRSFTARLLAEVKAQAILIEKLRHQLPGHRAHRFGASSETAEQLQLALETSEIAAAAMAARMKLPDIEEKDKPKRRPIPDHIQRMEVDLTPGADACADCGRRLRRIGEDVTEELEYVPGRFIVNRIVRPRLTCSCCEKFVQSPLPSRPIERGRRGPGLLAHVLVSKYADHLPLYRQSQISDREGLDLDRSTLADWVGKTTALQCQKNFACGARGGRLTFRDEQAQPFPLFQNLARDHPPGGDDVHSVPFVAAESRGSAARARGPDQVRSQSRLRQFGFELISYLIKSMPYSPEKVRRQSRSLRQHH